MWGDAGYQGVGKREENREREVDWQVAMRPGKRRGLEPGSKEAVLERLKAQVRAMVEHPFLKVKRQFGTPGFATADWSRTRSGWRCYWDWATC